MKKIFVTLFLFAIIFLQSHGQKSSFLVLGDLHYDRLEDHDMDWLKTKPDDLRQVTKEYTVFTSMNWDDFMSILSGKIRSFKPTVKMVVQLGDLAEGLAGSEIKAAQMASNVIKKVKSVDISIPWILAKGNHDITGPGAAEAFHNFYVPMIREQTNNKNIKNASYSYTKGDIQVICLDPWDRNIDVVAYLDKELSASKSRFKFVAVHEPVIPVTERCWHLLRNNPEQREKLLEVIAKNKAIVLTAHLHRYSVVRRDTKYGPIIQVMVVSVVKNRNYKVPFKIITEYGSSLAENVPAYQPETLETRKAMLADEAKHIKFYKQTDLPGYAIIKTDSKKESVKLEYYAAFGEKPYDKIDLFQLMK